MQERRFDKDPKKTRLPRSSLFLALFGFFLLSVALAVRSGIFARRNPGEPINAAMREALEQNVPHVLSEADATAIAQKYPDAIKTESGLMYVVRNPGLDPTRPRIGQYVTVNYDGRLLDGSRFDSSYEKGQPYTFRLGFGDVIKGWDEAFQGMRKGERRTLIIPYWLGYGDIGHPPKIPPRSTLVFEVELLDFR